MSNRLLKFLKIIWVSPNTLLGLSLGLLGIPFGSRLQVRKGCLEFYGGLVTWVLSQIPPGRSTSAMTLGHVILGRSAEELSLCRAHEQVHVAQYEQWGPLFIPVYLGWSLVRWLQSRDAYLDNPFEVEAYRIADPRETSAANSSDPDSVK